MKQNMLILVMKRYESKRVNFVTEFSCPGELFHFEPQGNKKGKVIKFEPFYIYPEDFKWTFLMISENLRPKKSENGLKLRIGGKC